MSFREELEDGKSVDVYHFSEQAPSWEKPAVISAIYKDDRWRSFMMSLWLEEYDAHREAYGEYLCRTGTLTGPPGKRLKRFEINYMLKMVLPDYKKPPIEKTPHLAPRMSVAQEILRTAGSNFPVIFCIVSTARAPEGLRPRGGHL